MARKGNSNVVSIAERIAAQGPFTAEDIARYNALPERAKLQLQCDVIYLIFKAEKQARLDVEMEEMRYKTVEQPPEMKKAAIRMLREARP